MFLLLEQEWLIGSCYFLWPATSGVQKVGRDWKVTVPKRRVVDAIFSGVCNVYRRLAPNFARATSALKRRLKKRAPKNVELNDFQKMIVDKLTRRTGSTSVLAFYVMTGQITSDTNKCDPRVGCVLHKTHTDETSKPASSWQSTINPAELSYDSKHKKCLDEIWAVVIIGPYNEGLDIFVRTDYLASRSIEHPNKSTARTARRWRRLSELDFELIYKPETLYEAIKNQLQLSRSNLDDAKIVYGVWTYCVKHWNGLEATESIYFRGIWINVSTYQWERDATNPTPTFPKSMALKSFFKRK